MPSSAHKEWKISIESVANVIEPKARSRDEFIQECKSGAFDNVVAAYRTFMSVAITGLIDEELVTALPKNLKFLCHNGRLPYLVVTSKEHLDGTELLLIGGKQELAMIKSTYTPALQRASEFPTFLQR